MVAWYNITMNEKEKAKLQLRILGEEYSEPDFGFQWKWSKFLKGFVAGIILAYVIMEIF